MRSKKTVVILAGGRSKRFHSFDKCFITLHNLPLIYHVIDNIAAVADELIVAARDEAQGAEIRTIIPHKVALAFDSLNGFGPLAGFLSGLERASFPCSLVVGCDMPFINERVVDVLFEIAFTGYDAVVPRWENGMVEPLHAVYRREPMLAAIREAVGKGEGKILTVLSRLKNVYFLQIDRIKGLDPDLRTFTNINTPERLRRYD